MIVRHIASRRCASCLPFTHLPLFFCTPARCRSPRIRPGGHPASKRRFATGLDTASPDADVEAHFRSASGLVDGARQSQPGLPDTREKASPIDAYFSHKHIQSTTGRYGSAVQPHYLPYKMLRNLPSPSDITLELLLASQTHLGHATSLWNPANSRYIFGIREGIHIISLEVTAAHLRRAAKVVTGVAERGGTILFVGTRPGQDRFVVRAAELAGACHLFQKWTAGTVSNAMQILDRCRTRVVDEHDENVPGFERQLIDLAPLLPDLVICLNPLENYIMLRECGLANIPTIGIIDTDANPSWVTYPIPANDDSLRGVQLIAGALGRAGQEGQDRRKQAAKQGRITYQPAAGLERPTNPGEEGEGTSLVDDEEMTPASEPVSRSRMGRGRRNDSDD